MPDFDPGLADIFKFREISDYHELYMARQVELMKTPE